LLVGELGLGLGVLLVGELGLGLGVLLVGKLRLGHAVRLSKRVLVSGRLVISLGHRVLHLLGGSLLLLVSLR